MDPVKSNQNMLDDISTPQYKVSYKTNMIKKKSYQSLLTSESITGSKYDGENRFSQYMDDIANNYKRIIDKKKDSKPLNVFDP